MKARVSKRIIATALILLQLLQPAHADLIGGFQTMLGGQIKQLVSQQMANLLGAQGAADPAAERPMTPVLSQRAANASLIFDAPLDANPGPGYSTAADTYDPANPDQTARQLARWKTFVTKTKDQHELTEPDLSNAAKALMPFLRYYVQALNTAPEVNGNTATVPPGGETSFALAGYCMDRSVPAPGIGEKLQLVPASNLIQQSILPLYQAMMAFSAQNYDKRYEIQNLVWGLRHAADPYPPIREVSPQQVALLNAATPNGAQQYQGYLQAQVNAHKASEAQKQLYRAVLGGLQSKFNISLPDTTSYGYTPQDTQSLLASLSRLPIDGTPQPKSEFTLLADGVAARTIANGLHQINVQVRNTTSEPYTFDANKYAGQSTRVTQRVAFGGILKTEDANQTRHQPTGLSAAQRLHDILQKLEIKPLKRLQAQIQQFIDRNAGLAGDGRLKLAGLALATAINEVLLPTSVLDVALLAIPLGKLSGVVERLGAREVLAVEQTARDFLVARHEALGEVTGRWTAVEPGPLGEKYAETFAGGRYSGIVLAEDTTLYRAGSGAPGKELGEYLSLDPAAGVLQARIDRAIQPVWPGGMPSVVDTSYAVKVPAGTTVYTGQIGYQSGFYLGGNWQVVVPTPWKIPGVVATKIGVLK